MQAQRSPLFHWFLSVGFQSEMIQRFVGQAEYERLGRKTCMNVFLQKFLWLLPYVHYVLSLIRPPKACNSKRQAASILQTQTYIQRLKVFSSSELCFQGIWTGKCFKWGFLKTKCVWIHRFMGVWPLCVVKTSLLSNLWKYWKSCSKWGWLFIFMYTVYSYLLEWCYNKICEKPTCKALRSRGYGPWRLEVEARRNFIDCEGMVLFIACQSMP